MPGRVPALKSKRVEQAGTCPALEVRCHPLVHPECRRPADVGQLDQGARDAAGHAGSHGGHRGVARQALDLVGVKIADEGQPAIAWQRREQHVTGRRRDQCRSVAREITGGGHVSHQRGPRIGLACEVLGHGFARHAVGAAGADDPASLRGLRSPVLSSPPSAAVPVGPLPVGSAAAPGHVVARQAVISPPTTIRTGPIRSPPGQSGRLGGLRGAPRGICPGESGSLRGRGGGPNDGAGDAADEIRDGRHGYPAQQRPV
jgi:hypothetical protein